MNDVKYGFGRSEMNTGTLVGTVDAYDRHVFLCHKDPESWPSRVEASSTDLLPKLLFSAVKARKNDISLNTKITISGGGEGTGFEVGDVLIFPDMIKHRGLKESDVESFVTDVLVDCKPWASRVSEVLTGSHIFVCAHGNRDKRCGACGPVLIDNLKQEIATKGLKGQVFVSPCSHIGGHKYAGNLIVFGPDSTGKITGHWYGYVTPNDVPEIIDQHIGKGEVIERLWRGQMGAEPVEEGKRDAKKNKRHKRAMDQRPITDSGTSCCQGTNGVSCCQDKSSDSKTESGTSGKMGLSKLSSWFGFSGQN